MKSKKHILIVCGGPSGERGISLNSARSLFDNLDKDLFELSLIYFNPDLKAFPISEAQIYSNTPLDFDFRLHSTKPLSHQEVLRRFRAANVVFPAIHGTFGEDGQLQKLLEKAGASYVGSGPEACELTNDKYRCSAFLKEQGFFIFENWKVSKREKTLPKLKPGK